jgi:adhesin/invasin
VTAYIGTDDTGGNIGTATVDFTVGAADATASTIAADPTSIIANGVTTSAITVTLKDANGNVRTAGGDDVFLTTTTGTLSGVTDNEDGTYTATLTSATVVGTATVTAYIGTDDTGGNIGTATVDFTVGAADATASTIAADPTSIIANGVTTSAITVTLKDANGNVRTAGGDDVFLTTTTGTLSGVTDNEDGTYTATLTSATVVGTATVTAYIGTDDTGGNIGTATVDFTVGAADATASTIAADPTSIIANGVTTSAITVTLKDANGNVRTAGGDDVFLTTTTGTLSGVTDNEDGTYTATLTSATVVGTATVTAYIGTDDTGGNIGTATVDFTVGAADATASTIAADPTSIIANGVTTSAITVTLKDANGNVRTAGGDDVFLTTTTGTLSGVTDNEDGTYTATLTSATVVGTATVTAYIGTDDTGGNIGTATVDFTVGAADATASTIAADPTSIIANGVTTSAITVTLKDANGNVRTAGGDDVFLTTTTGTLSGVTDNEDGTYTATLTSATVVGTATVTAYIGTDDTGGNIGTATVDFTVGAADATASTIAADPTSIIANGVTTSAITVTLKDANGNVRTAGGDDVFLTTTTGTLSGVTDNEDGTYTATLTSATVVGTATVTAYIGTDDTGGNIGTATVDFTVGAADATASTIAADPTSIIANGVTTSAITVTLKDANGNVRTAGGDDVFLTTTTGTLSGVTDNEDGTYTATLTSATVVGTATVTAYIGTDDTGGNIGTATVDFTVGAADATASTIAADPTSIIANGVTTSAITVTLKDANGNVRTAGGDDVFLTTTTGTLSGVTDNEDGTYTATLTSATVVGTATVTAYIGTDDTGGNIGTATVDFTVGPADATASTIVADPTSIIANGVTTSAITVTLKDANGNVRTSGGDDVFLTTTSGTLSSVEDEGNGTYTATLTSATVVGTATVTAYIGTDDTGGNIGTATVDFTVGPADATASTIVADPTSIIANGVTTSAITVTLKDANGNVRTSGGDDVFLTTTSGTLSSVEDEGNGTYTATLTSATVVGTATVTAYIGTDDTGGNIGTATVDFIAGPPNQISINAGNDQSAIAGTPVAIPPSVLVTDANRQPGCRSVSVTFTVASGGGDLDPASPATVETDASGIAAVTSWTLGTTAGVNTLTATSDGLTGSPLTFTATGKEEATITFVEADLLQVYDGNPKIIGVTTDPADLDVNFTFSPNPPVNAGTYEVTATIVNNTYFGTATATLVIEKADPPVTLEINPSAVPFTGGPIEATIVWTWNPEDELPVGFNGEVTECQVQRIK